MFSQRQDYLHIFITWDQHTAIYISQMNHASENRQKKLNGK